MAVLNSSNSKRKASFDSTLITDPTCSDILCGKDKTFAKHAGNQAFRDMILSYAQVYTRSLTKQSKMKLTKEIVQTLQKTCSARFLQPSRCGTGWNEISDQVARDKTSHALRFAAKGSCTSSSSSGSSSDSSTSSFNKTHKSMAAIAVKKAHRRQVSWNALDSVGANISVASNCRARSPSPLVTSSRNVYSLKEDFEPVDWKYTNTQAAGSNTLSAPMYDRQQKVLQTLSEHDADLFPLKRQRSTSLVMLRHDFDSLRSEDFESLMNDPALMMNSSGCDISDDWETVISLTKL
jgi:hypothetical protein